MTAPAVLLMHPSYIEPGIIMPYAQPSAAFETLGGSGPKVALGEGDLLVYAKRLDLRTYASAGQMAPNQLPGVAFTPSMISTATYLNRYRAEWDHHDVAAYNRWGINLVNAYSYGLRQADVQLSRTALLYGMNASNGEGLVNTAGAYTVSLPADSNAHTTVTTYDPGQMAQWLIQQVISLKVRMNQLGIPRKIVIVGPQRVLGYFEGEVVELTAYQRPGAGSASIRAEFEKILSEAGGDSVVWGYDDTLIGKGASSTDLVMIVCPEVERPEVDAQFNTNEFAKLTPSLNFNTSMYTDMVAPREILTPLPGGATDLVAERRTTSGWGIRPEAISLLSMSYP